MTQQEISNLRLNIVSFRGELDGVMKRPNPYPESVFREPDWREVNQVLESAGINMTGVNGSIGRICYENIQADVKALDTSLLNNIEDALIRLEKLEAAVAWHGWDEVPDGSRGYFEIKYLDGSLGAGTLVIRDSDVFVKMLRHGNIKLENAHEFATGWRYPVGDLG